MRCLSISVVSAGARRTFTSVRVRIQLKIVAGKRAGVRPGEKGTMPGGEGRKELKIIRRNNCYYIAAGDMVFFNSFPTRLLFECHRSIAIPLR